MFCITWWPCSVRLRYSAWLMPLCALVKKRMRMARPLGTAANKREVVAFEIAGNPGLGVFIPPGSTTSPCTGLPYVKHIIEHKRC